MKKIYYILFALFAFYACKNEEKTFSIAMPDNAFSFTPVAGGAIMHYKLPSDASIIGIKVRYKDFHGHEILRSGSSLCDTLNIVGFNEARHNLPAEVRLCKNSGEESEPIFVTFDTRDSGPVAFFDSVQVVPGWNGFSILCDNPTSTSGMANVFYLGKNPKTQAPDTILINSFNLKAGKDTLIYHLQQLQDVNTVIIRTEDFRGYTVKEKVWNNVASYNISKMDPSTFNFYCNTSIEDDNYKIGAKYLFDGDTKGVSFFDDKNDSYSYRTFIAGPYATGNPMYIDFHKSKLIAQLRLYAHLFVPGCFGGYTYGSLISGYYYLNKMPCSVTVFAAKDDSGNVDWEQKNWVQVSSFDQSPLLDDQSLRWCANCEGARNAVQYNSRKDIVAADSVYMGMDVLLNGQGEGYRYLKIVVNDVFRFPKGYTGMPENIMKYFTLQELEIYGKKDN